MIRFNERVRNAKNGKLEEELSSFLLLNIESPMLNDIFKLLTGTCYGTASTFRDSPNFAKALGKTTDQLLEEEAKKVLATLNSIIKELIQHHPQSRISSKAASEDFSRLLKSAIWGGTT